MLLTTFGTDPYSFHSSLANFNVERFAVGIPTPSWENNLHNDLKFSLLEGRYLEELREWVSPMTADCKGELSHFISWFESLAEWGPGQYHPLFYWLADHATADQMKWFLMQEAAGEAGFDDLVAYTQVKLPIQAKLECARNYWDEMGRGKAKAMHGPMLDTMVEGLTLKPSIESTVWESLALSNTMQGLAASRRYTYHSLGALGVIELTAPWRAAQVARGMRRLNFPRRTYAYFDLHAVLDICHSHAWIREIICPLVKSDPACAQYIAEGALMRLQCGKLCFDRYSQELGVDLPRASTARSHKFNKGWVSIAN